MSSFASIPLLTATAWIAFHLGLYLLWLRRTVTFRNERVITIYHLTSGMGLIVAVSARWIWSDLPCQPDDCLAVGSLHGLYSLTFLSLWSSAQGGFSLRILKSLRQGARPRNDVMIEFARMGDEKRRERLQNLRRVGLIELRGADYCVTRKGRLVARMVGFVHWLNDFRVIG